MNLWLCNAVLLGPVHFYPSNEIIKQEKWKHLTPAKVASVEINKRSTAPETLKS